MLAGMANDVDGDSNVSIEPVANSHMQTESLRFEVNPVCESMSTFELLTFLFYIGLPFIFLVFHLGVTFLVHARMSW